MPLSQLQFRFLELNIVVGEASSGGVICCNWRRRLVMSHFVQNMTDIDTDFCIVKNTVRLGFSCGRNNVANKSK